MKDLPSLPILYFSHCCNYCVDGFRVMVTESGALTAPVLSVTVRLNASVPFTVGAVNVGLAVKAPFKDTTVPEV
jgi:hypothetical protein